MRRFLTSTVTAFTTLMASACGSAEAPLQATPTVQRSIAVHMRTRNGPFSISIGFPERPIMRVQATVGAEGWIVNPVLDASSVPSGRQSIVVMIETQREVSQEYLLTASVSENNRTIRPDFPDIVSRLAIGESLTFFVEVPAHAAAVAAARPGPRLNRS